MSLQTHDRPLAYSHCRKSDIWHRVRRAIVLAEQDYRCAYCYDPLTVATATGDHIIPVSKGGARLSDNLAAACLDCNKAKGNLSAGQFLKIIRSRQMPREARFRLIWISRRLNIRIAASCRRILRSVGLPTGKEERS